CSNHSKDCQRSNRDRADWSAKVQRGLSEVRKFKQTAGMGACSRDREFAGKKTGLPACLVRPVCGRARGRAIAASPRSQDRHRTTHESGIRYRGGSGFYPGSGSFHQLVRAAGKRAWVATRARSGRKRKRNCEKTRGDEGTQRVARRGENTFPN